MQNDEKSKILNSSSSTDATGSNILVLILIIILFIGMVKIGGGMDASKFKAPGINKSDISGLFKKSDEILKKAQESNKNTENTVVLKDFDTITKDVTTDDKISYSTAISYFNTRTLSQTEHLVLAEDSRFGKYFVRGSQQKLIIYKNVDKKFSTELNSILAKYSKNPNMKTFNIKDIFAIQNESQVKTSKGRVIYRLYNECGNFCVIDVPQNKFYSLKGIAVNAKSASICDVILQNL